MEKEVVIITARKAVVGQARTPVRYPLHLQL
jgi:hypothetical protein